jgi:hypothetical protein
VSVFNVVCFLVQGLLCCEGAKEFRDRFMWAASVPRGSCRDEAALAENYYNSHHHERTRTPRPVEAGLKLIDPRAGQQQQPVGLGCLRVTVFRFVESQVMYYCVVNTDLFLCCGYIGLWMLDL